MKLYPYQRACVDFHLSHHYSLNYSEPGLGKTLMSLTAAKEAGGKVLVIGPRFLEGVWLAEAEKVGVKIKFVAYSMLHKEDFLSNFDFWIADEVHYLATPVSLRTKAFLGHFEATRPKYFIGLTGTPIRNRIPQIWTQLLLCSANQLRTSGLEMTMDYHKFCRHFCHVQEMRIHGRRVTKYLGLKEDKKEEFRSYLTDKAIRFRVGDVLKDLPEMTVKEVPLGLKDDGTLAKDFDSYINGRKFDASGKRLSALLKAPMTAEYCNGLIEGNSGPLLIFTDHVESAKLINDSIKGSAMITGATDMSERQAIVDLFQKGKIPALVATIGTMATGYTLTASRNVVFNDLSWTSSDNVQAEKRIHRIGQKNACIKHLMIATPTDAYITKTLDGKIKNISEAMG